VKDRRLHSVPAEHEPVLIDPPAYKPDEWRAGWIACSEVLGDEWEAWYRRGLEATPVDSGAAIAFGLCALSGFIVGFILCLIAFA
jgi:hypothetical protein